MTSPLLDERLPSRTGLTEPQQEISDRFRTLGAWLDMTLPQGENLNAALAFLGSARENSMQAVR